MPGQIDAPSPSTGPADDKSQQSLRTESARRVLRARMGVAPFQGCPWPPRPGGQLPDDSAKPPRSAPFPSLYLSCEETTGRYVRKCRASKTASQELFVYALLPNPARGCSRAQCSQCNLQIQTLLELQQYVVSQYSFMLCLFSCWVFVFFVLFLSQLSSHDRSLLLAQLRKKKNPTV